jgi:hypothetical protein
MGRFSNEVKQKILAALIRSAAENGGTPDYRVVMAESEGGRFPSFWTLRKWYETHAEATSKVAERRPDPQKSTDKPPISRAVDESTGDVLAFPGTAAPASRVPSFPAFDLTAMDRATFHRHMLGRLYETLDLAQATPLTLSSVKGLTQQLEHHYDRAKTAAADTPADIDELAFLERLEADWSNAPDQYFEILLSVYCRRHGIRLLALRPGADDSREWTEDGWRAGPSVVASAVS